MISKKSSILYQYKDHQVNSGAIETLAENTYNEIGQLTQKKVGNNLQTITYQYNVKGWLTQINNPGKLGSSLFGLTLRYENPVNAATAPKRYNGNISESEWNTAYTGSDGFVKRYGYQYDGLNRLTKAKFVTPNQGWDSFYDENLNYDLNGNITGLERFSKPQPGIPIAERIDNLSYTYTGNQVTKITDAANNTSGYPGGGGAITYDANGNMTSMPDKKIGKIIYNFLNLPTTVSSPKLAVEPIDTQYRYRADGEKISKVSTSQRMTLGGLFTDVTSTEYLDGFQYAHTATSGDGQGGPQRGDIYNSPPQPPMITPGFPDNPPVLVIDSGSGANATAQLQFVPTAEGYFDFVKSAYIYNYVDQLGNVRLSYYRNGAGALTVLEENNYYPFGLKHEGYNQLVGNPVYQYKYSGKELQETGMYDYGARFYMPDIARFGTIDPRSQYTHEAYSYVWDNPIFFNDPTGMTGEVFASCPTCPNTPQFQPYINDTNNTYVYNPTTGRAEKETQIPEVIITVYGSLKTTASAAVTIVVTASEAISSTLSSAINAVGAGALAIGRWSLWTLPLMLNGDSSRPKPFIPPPYLKTEKDSDTDVNGVEVPQEGKSSKNEKHGDGGRVESKSEKQIKDLEKQKEGATKKERQKIDQKIKNIRENAQKSRKGEEHSRANKR